MPYESIHRFREVASDLDYLIGSSEEHGSLKTVKKRLTVDSIEGRADKESTNSFLS